jgi:hypothetical protein
VIECKYREDAIIVDIADYVTRTYSKHYNTDTIQCFDAWIALGSASSTFRDNALKYLWRYGKKDGSNRDDLMKAIHYIMMCLYVDHYSNEATDAPRVGD